MKIYVITKTLYNIDRGGREFYDRVVLNFGDREDIKSFNPVRLEQKVFGKVVMGLNFVVTRDPSNAEYTSFVWWIG